MDIIEEIHHYCEESSTPLDNIQESLMSETYAYVPGAHMITGHLAGHFLSVISRMVQPKYIIELGTYTGFSAICLAQGLKDDGVLHTVDIDNRWQELRNKYWKESGLEHKIIQHIGPGLDVLNELNFIPELAFIDADKGNYWAYTDKLIQIMAPGSWIVVDNVLFKNEFLNKDKDKRSRAAQHIIEYNQKIALDDRVETLMLPIRDGISILRIK